jgi:hypothetical protein
MILVLSGEGPTDIGTRKPKETGWEFAPGPMAWIVDKLLERPAKLKYSVLALHADGGDCVCLLGEMDLAALRGPKPLLLPRGTDEAGSQYFRKGAYLLGKRAKVIATERSSPVIAVFFRDADGTNSTPKAEWQKKFDSMRSGFEAAEFSSGVPMVPRPKSEAWMLCGLLKHEDATRDCSGLEDEPGNDSSPRSLKSQLARHLKCEPTAEQQADLIRSGHIDPETIDLPSFIKFRQELDRAYANAALPIQ